MLGASQCLKFVHLFFILRRPKSLNAKEGTYLQPSTVDMASNGNSAAGAGASQRYNLTAYSEQTRRSLAAVDESLLNYELMEATVCHVVKKQVASNPNLYIMA